MNLPNRLTMMRVCMIPVIVALMMAGGRACGLIAVLLFAAASFTDFLDGHIARSRGLVTDFGKFMDPIADKLLVTAVMIMMVERGLMAGWILVIFVAREFIVSGLRLVAAGKGTVSLTCYYAMDGAPLEWMQILSNALIYLALIFSVWSGTDYLVRNRSVIADM